MPTVRILHASDLHIAERPELKSVPDRISAGMDFHGWTKPAFASTYNPAILQRLADFIIYDSHAKDRLHAVLLTGDLATTGQANDLDVAIRFIEGPPGPYLSTQTPDYKPTLASISAPIWLLPGNHDRLQRAKYHGYSPGGKAFDTVFASHWSGPVLEYPMLSHSGLSVAVVAADFNLQHKQDREGRWWNKYAQGRVYPDILEELVQRTQNIQNRQNSSDSLAVIWAIHFPPMFPALSSTMKLIGDKELVRAANECKIAAILAGHTHEPVRYRAPGMQFEVFCAGTASQDFAPHGHYVHILTVDARPSGEITIAWENFRFTKQLSAFVKV